MQWVVRMKGRNQGKEAGDVWGGMSYTGWLGEASVRW